MSSNNFVQPNPKHNSLQEHLAVNAFESVIAKDNYHCRCSGIPRRFCLALLSFFGLFNVYAMRVNLSVAIEPISCQFNWNETNQGIILACFFVGYTFGQIPGGWLATKYGGKLIFGMGVLATSVLTFLLPFCATHQLFSSPAASHLTCNCATNDSSCFDNGIYTKDCSTVHYNCNENGYLWSLGLLRAVMGLFEGVTFPALYSLINHWTPAQERSKMLGIILSGFSFGNMFGFPMSSEIIASNSHTFGGWPNVFYIFSILGIVWWLFWIVLVYDSPLKDPFIQEKELKYLVSELQLSNIQEQKININIPWRTYLTNKAAIALYFAHFSYNWSYYTLLTELPSYLNNQLGYDLSSAGVLTVIPYMSQFFMSIIGGIIIDKLIASQIFNRTICRKIAQFFASIIPAILLVICGYLNNTVLIIVLMSSSSGLMGFATSGMACNFLDISSPFHCSIIYAISNTIGSIPGIFAPIVAGLIRENISEGIDGWRIIFWIAFFIFVIGDAVYFYFAIAEKIPAFDENDAHPKLQSRVVQSNNFSC